MIVTIDPQARPCPGVEQAVLKTEERLRQNETIYAIGDLIHNRREVARLEDLGLNVVSEQTLDDSLEKGDLKDKWFLIRAHGERENVIEKARKAGMKILDAACPIVLHSQKIVDDHIKEGWGVIIAGKKTHPEVVGLVSRSRGLATVIDSVPGSSQEFDNRSVLLAQSTIDPDLFDRIRARLIKKIPGLKVVDTTCRFLQKRQESIRQFSAEQDIVIHVGGKNSSNGQLLYKTGLQVNERTYHVSACEEVDSGWFRTGDCVGVTGCASTPRWQLDEMQYYLQNLTIDKNPKGLKNRKGGKFLWWTRKKTNSTK